MPSVAHLLPRAQTDKGLQVVQFCTAATGLTGRFLWSIIPPPLTGFLRLRENEHRRFTLAKGELESSTEALIGERSVSPGATPACCSALSQTC